MSECSRHHSQYLYHAMAYGLAAEIERPIKQSIPTQSSSVLSSVGGRGSNRVVDFSVPPFISFDSAYTEVGGSFDECHNVHTTYAQAVIEGLNFFDIVTADRIVARMAVYSPEEEDEDGEHSFSITGSHFDNLRIAGHAIDVKLATSTLHQHDTYAKFEKVFLGGGAADLLPWGNQSAKGLDALEKAEEEYHALHGIGKSAKAWNHKSKQPKAGFYHCSALGHLNLADHVKDSELRGFGGIILVPKFGVVRLAEVEVRRDRRKLTMLRVHMCSPGGGGGSAGSACGSGGRPFP
jgi:hypothetical protein